MPGPLRPAARQRGTRRVGRAPEFCFFGVGVVSFLARRGGLEPGSDGFGKALESWAFHELCAYREYRERFFELSYWRLPSGIEVDFVVNDVQTAIEVKSSRRIAAPHLKGLRELAKEHATLQKRYLVCLEDRRRRTEDGIDILPAGEFVQALWADGLV